MENENIVNAEVTNEVQNTVVDGTDATTEAQGQADNSASATKSDESKGESNVQMQSTENKPKQDSATNKAFQAMRKEHEKALREAQKQERLKTIKEFNPINPYNSKPIEDDYDVEEFLLMKKIEAEGGDPVGDYSEYLKRESKAKIAKEQTAKQAKEASDAKVANDLNEFSSKYGDVDINELFKDEGFRTFADGKLESKSLSEVYEQYLPFKKMIEGQKSKQDKEAMELSLSKVGVGSLTNSGGATGDTFFTKEQVLKMSPAEIKKNYEKIRESQQRWR
ncbi:MAG: hypothetical protein IJW54_06265 [Clostridia bacterium]|nr:hypothetical protein [Clostridia bacterium]